MPIQPAKQSLAKNKIKILLTENIHPSAVEQFTASGYTNIDQLTTALNETDLLKTINQYNFIGVRSNTYLTAKVLTKSKLGAIGCFCIGTNQVNLTAARQLGIPVFHAPYENTRSVAELVIGKIIFLMRDIPRKNAAAHRGEWIKSHAASFEIRGKTLGIIGYGKIGSQVGVLAEALGMKILYYDIHDCLPLGNAQAVATLPQLLKQVDVVTLHVPETAATAGLIGTTQLKQMKRGALLINTSRGTVVDITALTAAIASEQLRGASIDVFPVEPKSKNESFISPLQQFDNVILTPHIGGSTHEAQANIGRSVARKLVQFSDTGNTSTAVNFAQVDLPSFEGKHRLLHIHRNKPGLMAKINQVFTQHHINVAAQYLQTAEDVGYVVMDVDPKSYTAKVLTDLKKIPDTIKARILY